MAVGKSQKRQGKQKKGGGGGGGGSGARAKKKKTVDHMLEKEWYDVVAPRAFKQRQFCKTICNKSKGIKLAKDNLMGRIFEANLADLDEASNRDQPYRKVKLEVVDIKGRSLLTQFCGMSMTTDKIRSIIRKRCALIETTVEAQTSDGYTFRVFVVCSTARQRNQLSRNCYPAARLKKWVRFRMTHMIQQKLKTCNIHQTVLQFTHDTLQDALFKRCNPIVPIRDVKVTKVKMLQRPKHDPERIMEAHGELPMSLEDVAVANEA